MLVAGNMIGPDGVLALINLTRICAGLTLLDLREQKAHFSDNYFDIFESNIIEVIGMTVCIILTLILRLLL